MLFLTNPRHKKRKRARRKAARFKKGSIAAKRYMASIRPNKGRKRRKARRAHRAPRVVIVRTNRPTKGGSMARKRRSSTRRRRTRIRRVGHVVYTNPRKRHRRHYRRNPSGMRGIAGLITAGVKDGLYVVTGSALTSAIPKLIPGAAQPGMLGLAIQLATATGAGIAAHKVLGQNAGRLVLAGGYARVITTALIAANIPMVSGALSGNEDVAMLNGYPGNPEVAGYLQLPGVKSTGGLSPVSAGGLGRAVSMQNQDDLSFGIY